MLQNYSRNRSAFCFILLTLVRFHSFCYSLSFAVTHCHFLLLFGIRCHSLSFVVTRCYSLSLVVIRSHSLYHSFSLVFIRCTNRCHSLSLIVTRCTTHLSFYKQSAFHYELENIFMIWRG